MSDTKLRTIPISPKVIRRIVGKRPSAIVETNVMMHNILEHLFLIGTESDDDDALCAEGEAQLRALIKNTYPVNAQATIDYSLKALQDQEFITMHDEGYVELTSKGFVRVLKGGYYSELSEARRIRLWVRTKTVANILEALVIIVLSAAAVYLEYTD